jgi:hypothetical protein
MVYPLVDESLPLPETVTVGRFDRLEGGSLRVGVPAETTAARAERRTAVFILMRYS